MFKLRPYQEQIADKVFNYMRSHPGKHPLIGMPTGSGKTVVMSDIIQKAISRWPDTKILVLSHVKEILIQNHKAISKHTGRKVGLNSAGLGRRDREQITVAGIQSIYKKTYDFIDYKLVIIDECHLIPPNENSMYRSFFKSLGSPRYVGMTATPFRLGSGKIYGEEDSIFDDMVCDLTSSGSFIKLIEDGYLCDLRTKATATEMNPTTISTRGGDYDQKELSEAFDQARITEAACKEIIKLGADKKKWLIFAIDIKHAESIADYLTTMGIPTLVVHSKMEFDRSWVIGVYKQGRIRALVNINVLTTGFDDPEIDLIALLRPTKSPVIHVQTIGRGLRKLPGKDYCLILDFAGNTERLGPINDITIRKTRKGQHPDEVGDPPTKRCPDCSTIVPIREKICPDCGYNFPIATNLNTHHSNKEIITKTKKIDWYDVLNTTYNFHIKSGKPPMVKVSYQCGMRYFNEYVCIEHKGYAGHKAAHWVHFRGGEAKTAKELLSLAKQNKLAQPDKIQVDTRGKFPIIINAIFNQDKGDL